MPMKVLVRFSPSQGRSIRKSSTLSALLIFVVISFVSVLCESSVVEVTRTCMERSVIERVEEGYREKIRKKNRRRSSRRSKQSIPLTSGREAEDSYRLSHEREPDETANTEDQQSTCHYLDKNALETEEAREAFPVASVGIPCKDQRKLVSKNALDGCNKFYMWLLIKKKEKVLSEARVLALGPKSMSIYVPQLAIEKTICYDDVEGLTVEWLEATSTVILTFGDGSLHVASPTRKIRMLEECVMVKSPLELDPGPSGISASSSSALYSGLEIQPLVFPITVGLLSTVPVVLHAVGEGACVDISARLYGSSYLK
ncbi:hypothetical protein SAY86_020726 [Trapa natans]|uniref:Uncharacterized protein n=1 Tax=Trapa natans TaxID=22666 RepID=A0AAN7R4G4_TRANT|nr:hypothetical protein SAY86_020726 [Trapa natans]